ncbi:MAG: class I SAM-dependent methyltransferase [Actinomycetota bacterium]
MGERGRGMAELIRRPVRAFLRANKRLSQRWAGHLPHTRVNAFEAYARRVQEVAPSRGVAVDAGAGTSTPFSSRLQSSVVWVVGVDLSYGALAENRDVDAAVVADLQARAMPFGASTTDVVASRAFLEHLPSTAPFFEDALRVLRPGGWFVALAPGRYSWFGMLNRIVPDAAAGRVLFWLHPESVGVGGHKAYYDHLWPPDVKRILDRLGFCDVSVQPHYGTNYAYSFVPLFALTSLLELGLQSARLERFCSTMIISARRPPVPGT